MSKSFIPFILLMTFSATFNLKANPFEEKIIETRNQLQKIMNIEKWG